jgi:hypothetical protein
MMVIPILLLFEGKELLRAASDRRTSAAHGEPIAIAVPNTDERR